MHPRRLWSRFSRFCISVWIARHYAGLHIRLARYRTTQRALSRRYELEGVEPAPYSADTRARMEAGAAAMDGGARMAFTSGSTQQPKRILYTPARIRRMRDTYVAQALLAHEGRGPKRRAVWFLNSFKRDRSVSALLSQSPLSLFFKALILVDSTSYQESMAGLLGKYGEDSLLLALVAITSPTLIVSVNPSSLSVLLRRLVEDWERIRGELAGILTEDWVSPLSGRLGPDANMHLARLREQIARTEPPLPAELLPDLAYVSCWDGGYVRPFLDNLRRQLAPLKPTFRPMFSMSTEVVATLHYPRISTEGGLPIYPGVRYEFTPADEPPVADALLDPWQLSAGERYRLVVSDAYGLKRYDTEDIFACIGVKRDAPILKFVGRAGVNYSFTGEKITDRQLMLLYDRIRDEVGDHDVPYTCFPRLNDGGVPGYVFVRVAPDGAGPAPDMVDHMLREINTEYASKRSSNRLAQPVVVTLGYEELVRRIRAATEQTAAGGNDQFKMLPLHQTYWERLG